MKKSLLAIALASAGFGTLPAFAQDTAGNAGNYQPGQAVGTGNWFLNGSVGQSHLFKGPYDDHPTTYAINGGYRWKVGPDVGLGVEIGYNDLGNFKLKNAFNSNNVNLTSRRNALRGWTAGVNGKIDVWKGHGYSDQDINRHNLDKVDYYAGAGVGYDINEHFGLGLSYDYYHADKDRVHLSTDTASLTAEYRF